MEARIRVLFSLSVLLYLIPVFVNGELTSASSCDAVKNFYEEDEIGNSILQDAKLGSELAVCNKDGYTCCTPAAENLMFVSSMKHIQGFLKNRSRSMTDVLQEKGEKLDIFLLDLLDMSRKALDSMFSGTYGDLYSTNADVFVKFFDGLKKYYQGNIDLTDIFDNLFTSLIHRVFKLFNHSYMVTEEYSQCITDNLHIMKPFNDLPQKLENQIQRSFVATRTYVIALKSGKQVIDSVSAMPATATVMKEFTSLIHCGKCAGYTLEAPCHSTCGQIVGKYLCDLNGNFVQAWTDYVDAMNLVLDRLDGPFDVEIALAPIDVRMSEGVMMLQDNRDSVTEAVIRQCGPLPVDPNFDGTSMSSPLGDFDLSGLANMNNLNINMDDLPTKRRSKRSAGTRGHKRKHKRRVRRKKQQSTRYVGESYRLKQARSQKTLSKSRDIQGLINEFRPIQKELRHFWNNIPTDFCSGMLGNSTEQCWNGHNVIKTSSDQPIEKDKLCGKGLHSNPHFHREVSILKDITSKLMQAYRGIDSDLPIDSEIPYDDIESSGDASSGDYDKEKELVETTTTTLEPKSTPANKGKIISNLKNWEIEIIELALDRPVDRKKTLKDVKETVLETHPHLSKHGKQIKMASLTDNQVRQLRKILGIQHNERNTASGTTTTTSSMTKSANKDPRVATAVPVDKTTSSASKAQTTVLLVYLSLIFVRIFRS